MSPPMHMRYFFFILSLRYLPITNSRNKENIAHNILSICLSTRFSISEQFLLCPKKVLDIIGVDDSD